MYLYEMLIICYLCIVVDLGDPVASNQGNKGSVDKKELVRISSLLLSLHIVLYRNLGNFVVKKFLADEIFSTHVVHN